ncbi:hypothetical protein BDN71DRAFT_1434387 [Pleurotus eryngii]|uniref:peptidylprolyl isomerase n=1 Tax=Pleurotus eryngii TaxID=5323 RepID=A0A9P5ZS53_PLEER|nr:hypothetical protein BDN71DRAFT_1434387 [Pleurotus eryngii]
MTTHAADTAFEFSKRLWRKHIQPDSPIHITNAALPQTLASATGRSVVRLRSSGAYDSNSVDGSSMDGFILVSLLGGRLQTEQAALDFYFQGSQSYTFEVVGNNDVFLAGNLLGTASQPVERTSSGASTHEIIPRTQPDQQAREKRDKLSLTSLDISTSSETSNATVIPTSVISTSSETSNTAVVPESTSVISTFSETNNAIKANFKGLDKVDFSKLNFIDIQKGKGEVVVSGSRVSVYYDVIVAQTDTYIVQWHPGGNRAPIRFNQGIIGMREGGVREIYVPCFLAYGRKGVPKVPPDSDLIIHLGCALDKVDPADF